MNTTELGAAIRRRRRALELTQDETAELADVSTRVLSDLENGRATVRLDILLGVADALGLDIALTVRAHS
ncbi:helix-turn-helix domain-containing protein [Specibacter cremeus]|uniref:helix-turn-helix domain-containing protein n=1 Tax=Specibacter cremeus TaxID=1629051 RepID=UPI0013DDE9BF|nr:helix-turn-helix domain-containing protein [Specibacter cremeus]